MLVYRSCRDFVTRMLGKITHFCFNVIWVCSIA